MNPMLLFFLQQLNRPQPSTAMSYDYLYDSQRTPGILGDAERLDFASMPPPQETSVPEPMPGFDMEAARKDARRQGLGALGMALLQGAGTGDYTGSLARGFAGMAETRHRVMQEAEQRQRLDQREAREREAYDRQDRMSRAQIENYEEDNRRQRELADAQLRAREIDTEKQRQAVERLPPEVQGRLEPFIGTPDFYKNYWEATTPPKPEKPEYFELSPGETRYQIKDGKPVPIMSRPPAPGSSTDGSKPPTTRIWSDGSTRQWNAETKSWDVVAEGGGVKLEKDVQVAADRKFNDWLRARMAQVGQPSEYYAKHPKEVAGYLNKYRTSPKKGPPTQAEMDAMRKKFEDEARAQLAPAGGGNVDLYFDAYGNQVE